MPNVNCWMYDCFEHISHLGGVRGLKLCDMMLRARNAGMRRSLTIHICRPGPFVIKHRFSSRSLVQIHYQTNNTSIRPRKSQVGTQHIRSCWPATHAACRLRNHADTMASSIILESLRHSGRYLELCRMPQNIKSSA